MTRFVRRLCATASLVWLLVLAGLAAAGPAAADTPEGWPDEESIDMLEMLLVLGGIPLLIFVAVFVLVFGPSLARGESLPGADTDPENQWLGGPRKTAGELAGPDAEGSKAGGAGGTW
ncbi:MAG TPA: hypothetical protein VD859_10705 [Nocardioides sp.]|nr:hypothetical protein [Nocardioides sp.]